MSEEFEKSLTTIEGSVITLSAYHNIFETLFCRKELDLLYETAQFCFRTIWVSLADAILLRISRLLDDHQQNRFQNLVLQSLIVELPKEYEAIRDALEAKLKKIREKADPIITHRNKRIAHVDYETAMGKLSLPNLNNGVQSVIEAIYEFMDIVKTEVQGSTTCYEKIGMVGGADDLLFHLQNSLELIELRELAYSSSSDVVAHRLRYGKQQSGQQPAATPHSRTGE